MLTVIEVFFSLILGGVFLASAAPKLRHPRGFVFTVLEYRVLPPFFSRLYGWLLPSLEFLLALLLLCGIDIRATAIVLSLLLLSFIVAVGINVARGRDLDCNCFGAARQRKIGWPLLFQDAVLLGAAAALIFLAPAGVGLASWSIFRLFGLSSTAGLLPLLICVGLTVCATALLRKAKLERRRLPHALTRG